MVVVDVAREDKDVVRAGVRSSSIGTGVFPLCLYE